MSSPGAQAKQNGFVSFRDFFWTGASLIIAATVTAGIGVYLSDILVDDGFDNSTDTEDQLISLHDTIKENRVSLLLVAACSWLIVPFTLTHIYCFKLACESLFSAVVKTDKPNSIVHYLKWIYILSFILYVVFGQCLFGVFIFLTSYYNWEFEDTDDDTSYTGYYIQFMLGCAAMVCSQYSVFFMGITASIPWILLLRGNMDVVASNDLCCFTWCCFHLFNKLLIRLLMLVFIIIIVFVTVVDTFNWAKEGFFSINGYSEELEFLILISYELLGGWFIYLSCKVSTVNGVIDSENNMQEYSKLEGV